MGNIKIAKIPYSKRTDSQRLRSSWNKALKQFQRRDWSASVVRVATATEIAANIYVRQFLISDYSLPATFVDALLLGANGLDGKFKRLIKPAAEHRDTWIQLRPLQKQIEALNSQRNTVVHGGEFKTKKDATLTFKHGLAIVRALAKDESVNLALP